MGETIHQPLVNVYSITLNRRDEIVVSSDLDSYFMPMQNRLRQLPVYSL